MAQPIEDESPETESDKDKDSDIGWFYKASSKRLLWTILGVICGVSLIAEFFVHPRHGHFHLDEGLAFYAMLGFAACSLMIFGAKAIGYVLKAKPEFYEKEEHK